MGFELTSFRFHGPEYSDTKLLHNQKLREKYCCEKNRAYLTSRDLIILLEVEIKFCHGESLLKVPLRTHILRKDASGFFRLSFILSFKPLSLFLKVGRRPLPFLGNSDVTVPGVAYVAQPTWDFGGGRGVESISLGHGWVVMGEGCCGVCPHNQRNIYRNTQ